jgi:hypothetical protein
MLGSLNTESPAGIESLSGQESPGGVAYETVRDFRFVSREGVVFGACLCIIGIIVWRFKHVRGSGDNILDAGHTNSSSQLVSICAETADNPKFNRWSP